EDGIVPIMGTEGDFPDDALRRTEAFLDAIWGPHTRTENMNFLQECLGMSLENYLVKHFWKDHCKRYKKRPIYWLFASPKGAFQALAYMHRMNEFTVEKIRANYLIPHLKNLRRKIEGLSERSATLSKEESRRLDKLRKNLIECEAYDLQLKDIADRQIAIDLDDGVLHNYPLFSPVTAKIK
ncbi:MAG: SAM-dependent methyltransferase, partial [Bacteroidota bacterium]